MKQVTVLLILVILGSHRVAAQKGIRFGISGGPLFSRAVTLDSIPKHFTYRMKSGFNIGANLHIGFNATKGLSTGVFYAQKGYRIYNDTNSAGNVIKGSIGNLEIPLIFTFRQTLSGASFVRESIGVDMNFSLNSKDKISYENKSRTFRIEQMQNTKIYPMLCLGFEFGSETEHGNVFMFGAHYKQAFTKTSLLNIYNSKLPAAPVLFDLGFRGSYIAVQVTYLFNLSNLQKKEEFFY